MPLDTTEKGTEFQWGRRRCQTEYANEKVKWHYEWAILGIFLFLILGGCQAPSPPSQLAAPKAPATIVAKPRSVRHHPKSPRTRLPTGVLYEGPNRLSEWITYEPNMGHWRFADGALWTKSSQWIGRDVHLPERSSLEFRLGNPGLISGFFVGLYTKVPLKVTYSPKYHVANYYTLCIYPGTQASLKRLDEEGHEKTLAEATTQYWFPHDVKILTDKRARRFYVYFDGKPLPPLEDPESFAGEGTGITFQAFEGEKELSISRIRVSTWDGTLPPTNVSSP